MNTYQFIENSTGKVLKEIKAVSYVIAEEFFELHFHNLPIDGYTTKEVLNNTIQEKIDAEIAKSKEHYGAFNSTHEAYAVLQEEVEELWDIIKKNTERTYGTPEYKTKALIPELIQIASVAKRMAIELENNAIKFV